MNSEDNNKLHVRMFGRLELRVGDLVINDSLNRSRKLWNMLCYIIVNREEVIPQQRFINELWGEDNGQNPVNALKTLLYRIRLIIAPLEEACGKEFILSQRGAYRWNPELECVIDADEFEALCRRAADSSLDADARMSLYGEAMELYKGDFLPRLNMEEWAAPLGAHYHLLYLNSVKRYAALLESGGRFSDMEKVCGAALKFDILDEDLHCLKIRALIYSGRDKEALEHYHRAADIICRNIDEKPSDALRTLYNEIMTVNRSIETDLGAIQRQLKEEEPDGVFVCEYGFFKTAYRLEARRAVRSGLLVFIGLFTVSTPSEEPVTADDVDPVMERLLESIKHNLRKGDVASKYSAAQYVVMLPALSMGDGEKAMERIASDFHRSGGAEKVKLYYKLQQIDLPGHHD